MKLSKENFRSRWDEVSGFDLRKLLEDTQDLSLPMISVVDAKPVLFAFVFTRLSNGKIHISQRHFWDMKGHSMVLCKKNYDCGAMQAHTMDTDEYLDRLHDVVDILFMQELSNEDRRACQAYFSLFDDERMMKVYLSENKPLLQWAMANHLL